MAWGQVGNIRGPQGEPGTGVQFKGSIDEAANLPSTGLSNGDMWITEDDGKAHIWEDPPGSWLDAGQWLGPEGPQGSAGTRGSLWYTGAGAPGTIAGEAINDLYLNLSNGDIYRFT